MDPLYALLSRDNETRKKAELILLSRAACGFAPNVPSHPVLFGGILDPSTHTPVSGCCLLPTGTRLNGVWQNGRFAEGTIELVTPELHYLYRGRFEPKLETLERADVMDGVNVTLKEGLFLDVRAIVSATGGYVFIGSFEPPRWLAGYPKLTFGRLVQLFSYQLVPNAVLNHQLHVPATSSSSTTTPSTAAAATNLPTRHPINMFEFHFLGDLCTKFQTATTDSLARLIDEGKLTRLFEGSFANYFFLSSGVQYSNGACSVGSCDMDGGRCFLVEGISWSPQSAFRGQYVRGSIMHVGAELFAAFRMKCAGLFLIGDDEGSSLLRGVRLEQLTVSSVESHSSNDNHNNNNNSNKNKGAASPSPLSVAATQHTEVGTYSAVGRHSLRAGTRWRAQNFADGLFSQDTFALVCGVYTAHANPSVHVRIPQTFSLRNETDQSRVPCALPARAAMNSSGLRQWFYTVPCRTTQRLFNKQVHAFDEDDALLLEHAFYHGDFFAVVSKGTVVFEVDPQESGWRQGSPRLGALIQDPEQVYWVVAEPRLTEELYFETLRSAASETDIMIHLDPHAHNPEVVTTTSTNTAVMGASSTIFFVEREPSLSANNSAKKLRNTINADHVPSHFVLNLPRYRWQLLHFDGVREQFAYPVVDAWDPGMSTLDGPLGTGGLTEEDELALDHALMHDTITPVKLSVGYVTLNQPVRFVTKDPIIQQTPSSRRRPRGGALIKKDAASSREGVMLHRLAGEFHTSSSKAKMMQTPSFQKRQLIPPEGGSDATLWANANPRQPSPSADEADRLTLLNHYSMTLQDSFSSLAFVKDYLSRWMGSAEAEVSSTILLEPVPEQLDDGRGSWQITVDFIYWLSYRFACVPLIVPAGSRGDMHGIWVSQLQHATSHAEAAEMGYALWLSHWREIEEELRKRRLQFRPMQSLSDARRQRRRRNAAAGAAAGEGGGAGGMYEPFPYGLLVRFVGLGSAPQLALAAARARDSPFRQPPVPARWLTTHLLHRKRRLSPTDTLDSVVSELPLFVVLPKTSEEFMEVQNAFPNSWTVLRIERVQNVPLYRRFAAKRRAIAAENDGRSNEVRWMAHGTRTVDSFVVAKNGFDFRYSKVGKYGRASYFAFDARYAHSYRHTLTKENAARLIASQDEGTEVSELFLANVVCGKIEERLAADNSIRHPKDGYHSIAGPLTETHRGIMTYDLDQAYPAYLITYMH